MNMINLINLSWSLIYFFNFFFVILMFKKYLSVLILIELLILNLFMLMCFFLKSEVFLCYSLYFLVIVVCESSMGLTLLISMIRLNGSSSFNFKNFLLC